MRRPGRYLGVSVAALAVDLGTYAALLALGAAAAPASAAAYCLGIAAHWLGSAHGVFTAALAPAGRARTRQQALFAASALVGLALTTATVALLTRAGADPRMAKLAAVALSFAATWALRARLVFTAP